MRVTSLFRKLLGAKEMVVVSVMFDRDIVFVDVKPRWRRPRCSQCGRVAPGYDRRKRRYWRHLAYGGMSVCLAYAPRRVKCPRCGIRTERVPWAPAGKGRFTWEFEEMTAYLAQITDKTTVTKIMGVSWVTVGAIVERVVARSLDGSQLDDLRRIGVDEFSHCRGHRYITIVVDHDTRRVVWAAEGKGSAVLGKFFRELGPERCQAIEEVTIDMSGGYQKAIEEHLPQAEITYDRFHVQRLASDALDEVRRELVNLAETPEEARSVKGTRFVLLKNPWNLTKNDKLKLSQVQKTNQPLYRAYLLKETLAQALDYVQPKRALRALTEWLDWASRSRLKPFIRIARTIRKRLDGILAYIRSRLTNGIVEGINNKLRMISRRAYGFHSADALIAMLFLNCGGIELSPSLPRINPLLF